MESIQTKLSIRVCLCTAAGFPLPRSQFLARVVGKSAAENGISMPRLKIRKERILPASKRHREAAGKAGALSLLVSAETAAAALTAPQCAAKWRPQPDLKIGKVNQNLTY